MCVLDFDYLQILIEYIRAKFQNVLSGQSEYPRRQILNHLRIEIREEMRLCSSFENLKSVRLLCLAYAEPTTTLVLIRLRGIKYEPCSYQF